MTSITRPDGTYVDDVHQRKVSYLRQHYNLSEDDVKAIVALKLRDLEELFETMKQDLIKDAA